MKIMKRMMQSLTEIGRFSSLLAAVVSVLSSTKTSYSPLLMYTLYPALAVRPSFNSQSPFLVSTSWQFLSKHLSPDSLLRIHWANNRVQLRRLFSVVCTW